MTSPPSTALVGPLPTIWFQDGTRLAYQPPRGTLDNRYAACREHHPACDCREAHLAEEIGEGRAVLLGVHRAVREVLRDHATWAFLPSGEWDFERRCQCTGCQIARSEHLRSTWLQEQDGVPIHRPADWVASR